jgi:hypothetical protein
VLNFRIFNTVSPRQSIVNTDTYLTFVGIPYFQGLFYKLQMFIGQFGFNVVGKPSNDLFGTIFSKLNDNSDSVEVICRFQNKLSGL